MIIYTELCGKFQIPVIHNIDNSKIVPCSDQFVSKKKKKKNQLICWRFQDLYITLRKLSIWIPIHLRFSINSGSILHGAILGHRRLWVNHLSCKCWLADGTTVRNPSLLVLLVTWADITKAKV